MVLAYGQAAKVGALECADRAEGRLLEVNRKQRTRSTDAACFPIRLADAAEFQGLFVNGPDGGDCGGDHAPRIRYWPIQTSLRRMIPAIAAAIAFNSRSVSSSHGFDERRTDLGMSVAREIRRLPLS